jgi:hypothetical protein
MWIAAPRQEYKLWREALQDVAYRRYAIVPGRSSGTWHIDIWQPEKQVGRMCYSETYKSIAGFLFALCGQACSWPSG